MPDLPQFFTAHQILIRDLALATGSLALCWAGSRVVIAVVIASFQRMAARTATTLDDRLVGELRRPITRFLLLFGAWLANRILSPHFPSPSRPDGLYIPHLADSAIFLLTVLVIVLLINRLLRQLTGWYVDRQAPTGGTPAGFAPLMNRAGMALVYLAAAAIVLEHFGQNISSIVVSLGVGSIAIGLAAQESLSNMIAGFFLIMDRPFRIGDRIQLESGSSGTVEDIGIRSTRILLPDHTRLIVPNSYLMRSHIINKAHPDARALIRLELRISGDSDPGALRPGILEMLSAMEGLQPDTELPFILRETGSDGSRLELSAWVTDSQNRNRKAEELTLALHGLLRDLGLPGHSIRRI